MASLDRSDFRFAPALGWALLLASVAISHFARADAPPSKAEAEALSAGVARFAATLDESQSERARYVFDDDERFDLRLAPMGLEGLTIAEMTDAQWAELRSAFAGVLSARGLEKIETIRSLEREVGEMETGLIGWFMRNSRDPKRYFLALFGEPDASQPWGLRFDGHHLSLNWTVVPGAPLSVTPLFLGGQPREVPAGFERAGLRVLAEEEDGGVALVAALTPAERERARIRFREGGTIRRPMFVGEGETLADADPLGVARSEIGGEAVRALDALIDAHLATFAAPIAARYRARIAAQRESIRFTYAKSGSGSEQEAPRAGDPFYYRIQGGDFLIEFDDTPSDAGHVHVVFRERSGDFGRDLLAEHYGHGHPH